MDMREVRRAVLVFTLLGGVCGAAIVRGFWVDANIAHEETAATLTTLLHEAHQQRDALRDSVFLGQVDGFNVRCYLVQEN